LDEFYSNPQKKRKRKVTQFSTIWVSDLTFLSFRIVFWFTEVILQISWGPRPGEAAAAWATWSCHSLAISLQQASSWGHQGIPTRQWGLMINDDN
jgi:hypothetical protein